MKEYSFYRKIINITRDSRGKPVLGLIVPPEVREFLEKGSVYKVTLKETKRSKNGTTADDKS